MYTNHHLPYMDDIRLFVKGGNELKSILTNVKCFTDEMNVNLGLEKHAKVTLKQSSITETH